MARSRTVANRYEYKANRSVAGLKAQTVGEELERIREVKGELTPPAIVQESTPEEAVLHPVFEWNDATAAHEYRLHQARGIVNTVTVVHENAEGKEVNVPGFISVTTVEDEEYKHSNRQYLPVEEIVVNQELREQVLKNLRSRLKNLRIEYQNFSELGKVWEAIDEECKD